MSSRRRLYLNLKQSITKLFKTPAHYLKEITGKQSLYEKPYFDQDYRQMHLNLPVPSWKKPKIDFGPGIWPPSRKHTFVFDDGMCTAWSFGGACGETTSIHGFISLLPPGTKETTISWSAVSSDEDLVRVISVEPYLGGMSAEITVELSDTESGTATVCVSASMFAGNVLKELVYTIPAFINGANTAFGWTPNLLYAMSNLPPIYETRQTPSWDCGCVDLEIVCCDDSTIAWSASSPSSINPDQSLPVLIVDPLKAGGPYGWAVGGTGFSLTYATTTNLNNMLNAGSDACGTATITVTGCDGREVKGYVRSTAGNWSGWTTGCKLTGEPDSAVSALGALTLTKEENQYYQEQKIMQRAYSITSCDDEDCSQGCGSGACLDELGCEDCLSWDCADFDTSGSRPTCPPWCCGGSANPIGTCDKAGRCMCNVGLRWKEWIC